MKFFKTIIVFALPFFGLAQSFPTDAKVLEDVKKYHGKIATAKVQNEWKLEKETGYTFSKRQIDPFCLGWNWQSGVTNH